MADRNIIMTHLIAGYPDMETSAQIARAMAAGGAAYLEVQFPFSDPIADGPIIQGACTEALEKGFSVKKGFAFLSELTKDVDTPVYLMTYGNLVIAAGVENFVKQAADAGVAGLIIPDLPYDYDEGLYDAADKAGVPMVPVIIPGIDSERLESIESMSPAYIYTAIRKGITGKKSSIDDNTIAFLDRLSRSGANILAGFGIREKEQVDLLSLHVHGSVVGSALVDLIGRTDEKGGDCAEEVRKYVASLV